MSSFQEVQMAYTMRQNSGYKKLVCQAAHILIKGVLVICLIMAKCEKCVIMERTILTFLEKNAAEHSDKPAYCELDGEAQLRATLSYGDLYKRVTDAAATISRELEPSGRVIIALPNGFDFIIALLGTMGAGGVAVPYAPPDLHRGVNYLENLQKLINNTEPAAIIVSEVFLNSAVRPARFLAGKNMKWLTPAFKSEAYSLKGGEIAMLQYTSGSTAEPKGAVVTHKALINSLEMVKSAFEFTEETRFLTWLPMHHNMGLIGNILENIYLGATCYLLPREVALKNPLLWAKALEIYNISCSGGPNFSLNLLAEALLKAPEDFSVNLTAWREGFCGSEAIDPELLRKFDALDARYHIDSRVLIPCYGLSEATLVVTVKQPKESFSGIKIIKGRKIISCGRPCVGVELKIKDDELLVKSTSLAAGYWQGPAFPEWLPTGDLAEISEGELYIYGRKKEIIIIGGRNYYAKDIELAVKEHFAPGVAEVVALPISDPVLGTELLGLLVAINAKEQAAQSFAEIRQYVYNKFGLNISKMLVIERALLPTTSNGKVKRDAALALLKNTAAPKFFVDKMSDFKELGRKPTFEEIAAFCALWIEQNGGEPVSEAGLTADLLSLGLDSLKLSLLLGALEEWLNKGISAWIFGECQTINKLAGKIYEQYDALPDRASARGNGKKIDLATAESYLSAIDKLTTEELERELKN